MKAVLCQLDRAARLAELVLDSRTGGDGGSEVVVQPLTDEQIGNYLAGGGRRLAQLWEEVESNADLRDLLRTPLFLWLVAVTYGDLPRAMIPRVGNHEAWRRQLFREYVARMLERERELEQSIPYSPEEVERYLTWLAWQMRRHGLPELYLEQLQPGWLRDERAQRRYRRAVKLAMGTVAGLYTGLLAGLFNGLSIAQTHPLGLGILGGALSGVVAALPFGGYVALTSRGGAKIVFVDRLRWTGRGLLAGLAAGLLVGLVCASLFGVAAGVVLGMSRGLAAWQTGAIVFCVIDALLLAPVGLARGVTVNARDRVRPGEGIHRSIRNGLLSGLAGTLAGLLAGVVLFDPIVAIVCASFFGLYCGLVLGGGSAALRHLILRRRLQGAGYIPKHFEGFLRYASAHVLLQPVGAGYRFIHGLLGDYFTDLYAG